MSLISGVENFEKTNLKPTITQEKIVLPDKETIEKEKNNKPESEIWKFYTIELILSFLKLNQNFYSI